VRFKDEAELDPDEMPAWIIAVRQAKRLAERKGIAVKQIDGEYTQPAKETMS
jgi:hypothetical protein